MSIRTPNLVLLTTKQTKGAPGTLSSVLFLRYGCLLLPLCFRFLRVPEERRPLGDVDNQLLLLSLPVFCGFEPEQPGVGVGILGVIKVGPQKYTP